MDQPEYELTPNDVVKLWTFTKTDWLLLVGVTLLSVFVGGWLGFQIVEPPILRPWPLCKVCHDKLPRLGPHYHTLGL